MIIQLIYDYSYKTLQNFTKERKQKKKKGKKMYAINVLNSIAFY